MLPQILERVAHESLENNRIQRIVYHEVSRKAVDDFIALFDSFLTETASDDILRLIVDNEVGDRPQPLNYMLTELQKMIRKHPQRPTVRCAIVYERSDTMFSFIDVIVRIMARGRDKLRYFKRPQWEAMLDWLREDD